MYLHATNRYASIQWKVGVQTLTLKPTYKNTREQKPAGKPIF